MASVSSRSVSSVSSASVAVGWLVRLRPRAVRLSRSLLVSWARLQAAVGVGTGSGCAEGSPSADMPRLFAGHGTKYLALI